MNLLDIQISEQLIIAIIFVILVIIIWLIISLEKIKKASHSFEVTSTKLEGELNEKRVLIEKIYSDTKSFAQDIAVKQFDEWKIKELENQKKIFETNANEKARNDYNTWIFLYTDKIRKESAHKSLKTNIGKVAEHLLPFSHLFADFNPKDARFLGSPIDLIVFDGLCDEKEEIEIVFIEVKTGKSRISPNQKKIREAIDKKRISWIPMALSDNDFNFEY